MAEAFSFAEGSAQVVTGGATSLMTYVRDVRVVPTIGWYSYRPPHSTTYVYQETARNVSLSIGQVYAQKDVITMFNGATAGGVHIRVIHAAAGVTGELWVYSGVINSLPLEGGDGDVMMRTVQGDFQTWNET